MTRAVTASTFRTTLKRYRRSTGLWLLLLVAPVGARFMVAARGADRSMISVDQHVPWLTSQVLGMSLGVVISTLLLPVAFIYLRSNVNKRQPWQVQETTQASRIAIAYGRWLADVAVLAAVLAVTTAAGWLLALILMPLAEVDPLQIAFAAWVIAAPTLAMTAAVRLVLEAWRWTRGAMAEVLFFVFWMGAMVLAIADRHGAGYAGNMSDLMGFMSPLSYVRGSDGDFAIGGTPPTPGPPIVLDIMSGLLAPGYLASRLTWLGLAALVPLFAGLTYAPHVEGRAKQRPRWLKLLDPGAARPAPADTAAARSAQLPWLGLVLAEMQLIASGRPMRLAMAAVAVLACLAPWSGVAGPAAMLVLLFGATAHAGSSEQPGLLALTDTGLMTPMARRAAFVAAGTALALVMGFGGIVRGLISGELRPLIEAAAMGAGTSLAAILLAALTRSTTAPRMLLLVVWYAYLNMGGGTH